MKHRLFGFSLLLLGVFAVPLRAADKNEYVIKDVTKLGITVPAALDGDLAKWKGVAWRKIIVGEIMVAEVAAVHDAKNLYLLYKVVDANPLKNRGQDPNSHFKEGDCVDLMLGTYRGSPRSVSEGDLRLLLVPLTPPVSVLYRQIVPGTKAEDKVDFISPVRTIKMDSVVYEVKGVEMCFKVSPEGYVCEARVPYEALKIQPGPGQRMVGDMGVLSSNDGGMLTLRRAYLFNAFANVTADLPTETELTPEHWGVFVFE
ncbi:MAG: hypothetical protein SFY92_07795 [Verrucomicrobiae bacterium]|nr:hypothetical protein [Verrucomicrobiae bacterium]